MKISLLRQKEDFESIFSQSLTHYLSARFDWQGEISWHTKKTHGRFVVNDLLNIIYPDQLDRLKLDPLTAEFKWHPQRLRHLLQKLYVKLSVRKPWELFLRTTTCNISDAENLLENVVFIPGNHSHRLINVKSNICTVFGKIGSNAEFLFADANMRMSIPFLHVPKILQHDFSAGWFDEERVIGLPLNRLENKQQQATIITQCQQDLAVLYASKTEQLPVQAYVETLTTQLTHWCENAATQSHEILSKIERIQKRFVGLLAQYEHELVTTSITHGDYQPANILCAKSNFWIIDWEYAAKRSILYDAFTFELEARFTHGFAKRLVQFTESMINDGSYFSWTGTTFNKNNTFYLYLFLFEDLILKLAEFNKSGNLTSNSSINLYMDEISSFLASSVGLSSDSQ